ncbi:DUF1353 domain-containing protein [Bosea sp. (in: a-proteobacteria)]|uniref:DUF1353 domain-containing protein n=1 Tax=Bosea sp. (in: a-proteobacteria) TaxID=1871050 RepID=UPI002B4A9414|nr:DUF1353 domain-containing protein [Bosea sp. (in: a-proteobacteria)]WRH58474.1 MAG: DUF1353 domain-containing protein [Bosea sp. (in: a-proteobacteria)]
MGKLELKPTGCQQSGSCELVHDFGFIDGNGVGWQAKAGLKTDGASIPSLAQPFIGGPWDADFVKAAVLHDHYCIRTVRPRTATHRMFYNALIESGVSKVKASTMYYAVMVGSHMWIDLMEGQQCSGGMKNCVQNTGGATSVEGAKIAKNADGQLQASRPPRFNDPAIANDIKQAAGLIASGDYDSPEKVEALAKVRHPNDFFLRNGDSIRYQGPTSKYPDR